MFGQKHKTITGIGDLNVGQSVRHKLGTDVFVIAYFKRSAHRGRPYLAGLSNAVTTDARTEAYLSELASAEASSSDARLAATDQPAPIGSATQTS